MNEDKRNLQEYLDRIEESKKKAARWNRVALTGMVLSAVFMIAGIVLLIIMAIKGIG